MAQAHAYTLSVAEVADHYDLTSRTIRARLTAGDLRGVRIAGQWRCSWKDVFAAERGPMPRGARFDLYKARLLSQRAVAGKWEVSLRTVERWIEQGLPTRNVFGSVRMAPVDVEDWIRRTFGIGDSAV